MKRKIINIDKDKCNGCGLCIPSCKEGALKIVDGKAVLVSDVYCDGLGACLGECPQGALEIVEREASAFEDPSHKEKDQPLPCGCPGLMAKTIHTKTTNSTDQIRQTSELSQWPIQLALIPPSAPYLNNASLTLLADCTAVAYANLHKDFIKGRVIAMACPKLDNSEMYVNKLAQMIIQNNISSIDVVIMEVPCCLGLNSIAKQAIEMANAKTKLISTVISLEGEIDSTSTE